MRQDIERAVRILRDGGLVAFPTETVYGLGADACHPSALQKIFQAKQRPMDHPLIVHLAAVSQLEEWAREIPAEAYRLAAAFWPGPLTMIFKKKAGVSDWVTGNQDTIGLRIPKHPVAQALLKAFGGGIAAPSANRFGRISPTTATAVREELGDSVACILEGGQCEVGVESTILDLTGSQPVVLRPGHITAKQIEAVLHEPVFLTKKNAPRVSGSLESHYAPETLTSLIQADALADLLKNLPSSACPLAILSYDVQPIEREGVTWVSMSHDPQQYTHDIYLKLRELDKENFQQIWIEAVPLGDEWDAVRDRLWRASVKL
jgi:L-threonylcarbamoyladenylate synthase